MSVSNGPGIVTSGLVFHYDMGNPSKSYIGQPTANLSYNNGQGNSEYLNSPQTWTNSGAWSLNSNETDIALPNFPHAGSLPSNLRILSGVITSASTQGCQFGCGYTTVSPSTTYTMSVYYRQNRAMANNAMPYLRTNVNNNSIASFSYNGNYSQWTWPVNQWIRISATGTTQSNENGLYLSQYFGEFVGDKIWMCGHQVEAVSYATPLVAGTRSASQAIVDLTGNNTTNAYNLTYNNDNTFSFQNNYSAGIEIPNNNFTNLSDLTMNCVMKYTGTQDHYNGAFMSSGDWNVNHWAFSINQSGSGIDLRRPYLSYGYAFTQNQWYMVTWTRSGTTNTIFVNGTSIGSQTSSDGIPLVSNSGNTMFGRETYAGGYFNLQGELPVAQIYNRALSASEVKQNFSALRSRYGI